MAGLKEERSLAEVKAVLKKLQRLDLEAESYGRVASAPPARMAASDPGGIGVFDRKRAAIETGKRKVRPIRPYLVYLFAVGAVAAGAFAVAGMWKNPASNASMQQIEGEAVLIPEARRILNEGEVVLARSRLMKAEPGRRAEVALMLAQSYDPNFLRSLPKTNGAPDVSEAARWYRKWHELAVQNGLEMDSERLQRIINAMH